MDVKVINQIKSKNDLSTPTIIKGFDINKTVKDLKKRIYDVLSLNGKINLNRLGLFYSTNRNDRKNKNMLSQKIINNYYIMIIFQMKIQ